MSDWKVVAVVDWPSFIGGHGYMVEDPHGHAYSVVKLPDNPFSVRRIPRDQDGYITDDTAEDVDRDGWEWLNATEAVQAYLSEGAES